MKRTYLFLAVVLAGAASAAAGASAQSGLARGHAGRFTTVELRHTSLGKVLATASGFTLYEFTRDRPRTNSCAAIAGCPETWPALQVSGRPTAGPGVKASLLSTIKSGGKSQVTYAGHPLYIYSGDSGPGETFYVGASVFGEKWYAVISAGHAVK